MSKEIPNYEDQNAKISFEDNFILSDNDDLVEVPRAYLFTMLQRLADLQRLAKTHLAKADIPETKMYLFRGIKKSAKIK